MPFTRLGNHRVGLENRLADGLDAQAYDICRVGPEFSQSSEPGPLHPQRMACSTHSVKASCPFWICAAVGFWMSSSSCKRPRIRSSGFSSHVCLHAGSPRRLPLWLRRQVRLLECRRCQRRKANQQEVMAIGGPKGRLMGSWRTVRRARKALLTVNR